MFCVCTLRGLSGRLEIGSNGPIFRVQRAIHSVHWMLEYMVSEPIIVAVCDWVMVDQVTERR